MDKIFGIDLGTNSIGWAIRLLNEKLDNQIIKQGVLLFDKGVASEKGNEFPKVQKRTESRSKRRNYQAEKYRKYQLLEFLINSGLCPLTIEELNDWRKYRKGERRRYPQSEKFINWLRYDFNGDGKPDFHLIGKSKHESYYCFRAFAADEKYTQVFKENPHLLGRVFYQLGQRRGFKGRDTEEADTMLKGSSKTGTKGRNEIADYLDKYKTLGAALYYYQQKNGGRIRQRYNLRRDYENELKEICRTHNVFEQDYKKLWKAIIWQRPLRTQKGLIGLCTYEKNKRRVSLSHPIYQEYKTWVLINNLKIEAPEGIKYEQYLKEKVYPCFIRKSDFKVEDIINKVEKSGGKVNSSFAIGNKNRETKVVALSNFYDFKEIFGDDWKEKLEFNNIYNRDSQQEKKINSTYTIEDLWHVLQTFDSKEKLIEFGVTKLNLNEEEAKRFSEIRLSNGYATLSLSAVKRILPYLKRGIKYSTAVYLANLPKVFGTNTISDEIVESFIGELNIVYKEVEEKRKLNSIVNSLIKSHLEEEHRYFIENDRALDNSEKSLIKEKLMLELGARTWLRFSDSEQNKMFDYVAEEFRNFLRKPMHHKKNYFLKLPRLHQEIFRSLQEKYDLSDDRIKYLWHPSEQEKYPNAILKHQVEMNGNTFYIEDSKLNQFLEKNHEAEKHLISLKLLGSPEPISKGFKNPMALKTLHKLKQLLNYLLQTNQIDEQTKMVIEVARELNDNNMRAAIRTFQRLREDENTMYSQIITEINKECNTSFDINDKILLTKIRLWKEQNERCIYTGQKINLCDVFDGNKFDLEHTIPLSMSFDSELKNLTLSDTNFNRNIKKKQIPFQLGNHEEILRNVYFMKETYEDLERQIKDNVRAVKGISDKESRDRMIQKRHILKFRKDYWKKKYNSFEIEEFKLGWRNSQLKDTQIVTKYAIPYLKTVFNNVSVEKGQVVDDFKRIYKVMLDEKKDRSKHSHHAIDAAILTLIPNSYYREQLLKKYNKEKENKKKFHALPLGWANFKPKHIIDIEEKVLANNLIDDRTLTPTFKKVRKRGNIQRKENGDLLWSKGDTIRGQLHTETFYGAIKQPLRDENNKILFDKNKNMLLDDEVKMVLRKPLIYKKDSNSPGFKTLEEIEKVIVDKALFKQIKIQVGDQKLKDALEKGVWFIDKRGNRINRIRRIRCFEIANVKYESAIPIHKHAYKSEKKYKQDTLSQNANGSLNYCLFYEGKIKDKLIRKIVPVGLFELSKLKITEISSLAELDNFKSIKQQAIEIPLKTILTRGQKVIFYKDSKSELLELESNEINNRVYKIFKFESDGRINLVNHITSGDKTEIIKRFGTPSTKIEFNKYQPLLRISQSEWNFAIESLDFVIEKDGEINFKI